MCPLASPTSIKCAQVNWMITNANSFPLRFWVALARPAGLSPRVPYLLSLWKIEELFTLNTKPFRIQCLLFAYIRTVFDVGWLFVKCPSTFIIWNVRQPFYFPLQLGKLNKCRTTDTKTNHMQLPPSIQGCCKIKLSFGCIHFIFNPILIFRQCEILLHYVVDFGTNWVNGWIHFSNDPENYFCWLNRFSFHYSNTNTIWGNSDNGAGKAKCPHTASENAIWQIQYETYVQLRRSKVVRNTKNWVTHMRHLRKKLTKGM